MGANVNTVMIVVTLATALWWGFSRGRRPSVLNGFSGAALLLALVTVVVDGFQWQLVPWQVLALAVAVAAAVRRWRPIRWRRRGRVFGRAALIVGLAFGGLALLTAFVPALPKPSGPRDVGSVVFRWTDNQRPETLTADASDRRQVVAQAWYPTDATKGKAVPYFEAQGRLPSSIGGLPSFMFASFGRVATHAIAAAPVSSARRRWPVLFFSPGLGGPARGVHGPLRRPRQSRVRGRCAQRAVRVSGLGALGRQGRRSDDPSGCDGSAAASCDRAPDRHPHRRQQLRARPARSARPSSSRARRWPDTSICSTSGSSATRSAAPPLFR